MARSSRELRRAVPGPAFGAVRWISGLDAVAFALLLYFWLAPGHPEMTTVFGWTHGLGYITLCLAIGIAILRREAPYTLLAATLTPVGPFGSVIAIELIDRKGWGIASPADARPPSEAATSADARARAEAATSADARAPGDPRAPSEAATPGEALLPASQAGPAQRGSPPGE